MKDRWQELANKLERVGLPMSAEFVRFVNESRDLAESARICGLITGFALGVVITFCVLKVL